VTIKRSATEQEALATQKRLIEALAELRSVLRVTEASLKRALKSYETSTQLRDALESVHPSDSRDEVNHALEAVEKARHDARRAAFALGLEQGMTIGELARAWGFSRQLASRYAKEAKGDR
jgi:hypothetical protein